jgi:hypothetical protein
MYMNECATTWRTYLDEIIRQLDTAGKAALYEAVGVNRVSFQRWRTGENTPDARHAQKLLDAVPAPCREHLRTLMLDDPNVRRLLPSDPSEVPDEFPSQGKIPQRVYEEVLRTARDTPDRFWILSEQILFEALNQLETKPQQTGLEMVVAKCMPPRDDGKIRSLRAYAGRGTGPWRADLHPKDHFLGVESIAGYAIMQRHGVMIPNLRETTIITPPHSLQDAQAAAAYPLMRQGHIAGVLIASACQTNFFSSERLTLIEKYADLMRLAFYDEEFFPSSLIDLALMPPWEVQNTYFSAFRSRVNAEYKRSVREGLSLAELTQVEPRVRELLEGELLHLASSSDEAVENSV